jgi:hypothetical protein
MAMLTRRNILRGMMQGSAVAVALPLLDCFLDGSGLALAATGQPIPTRFGTWFWGCGINAARWIPDKIGAGYDMKAELAPMKPYQEKLTVLSGFNCVLGDKPPLMHWSGIMATLTGVAPANGGTEGGVAEAPTIDCLVADAIGQRSRFKTLSVACTGNPAVSYSMRAGSTVNPSEVDPVKLYKRLFGPEFQDPNSAKFEPDPNVMLRQSVLSSVKDERDDLLRKIGAADKARMDQYFTSVRELEQQLALLQEKPAPAEACVIPKEPGSATLGATWDVAAQSHELLADLLVMALACNQTRVFTLALSNAASNLRAPGSTDSFHILTHEEPVDETLGYQPKSTVFMEKSMETFATMLKKLDAVKEGDGTLLDHSLVLATSESNFAKVHSVESLPILVAGKGGGKWKSGQHIAGKGDPVSRVGLTLQQALGMPVSSWGGGAMQTSKSIGEVL